MNNLLLVSVVALVGTGITHSQAAAPLTLERTIPLPGITGKFDHFAMDEAGNRLFAASGGSHSVLVIDLGTGKVLQTLTGIGKPHGLVWVPKTSTLFVADGSGAELDIFQSSPLKKVKSIKLSSDADDIVYDDATKMLYVGHGGSDAANPAAVAVVDTDKLELVSTLPVAAHPEALEIDAKDDRIFVNVSDTGEIVVIDGATHAIADKWPLLNEKGNTPLAFDTADSLLLVACRNPAKLVVIDTRTGKEVDSATSDAGADDLFYNPATRTVYLIAGSGSVDSYLVSAEGKLQALPVTKTIQGAKTGLFVPSQNRLFIGVPGNGTPSEVRVYRTAGK